jgi:hypothetical protein
MQLQFEVLFSYFVFVFIEALPLSLEVSQVLTLLEDLSFSRKDQPRILVSLVLKGLRRNQTTKLGHLLKQRCNYFHSNRMISRLLSIYSLRININHVWSQIIDIKPLEVILKFGVNLHGRIHITEVYTRLY